MNSAISSILLAMAAVTTCVSFQAAAAQQQIDSSQRGGTPVQRSENAQAKADLIARFDLTKTRINEGRSTSAITATRAAQLHQQIQRMQVSMKRLAQKQGFVSAAELASYNRTLGKIDIELDGLEIPRNYGNDALVAPKAKRH